MVPSLAVYGTGDGQTANVADRTVTVLTERGHDASAADAAERPDRVGPVGSALRYPKYGSLERLVVKTVAGAATGETDTSRDHEYADWHDVETCAPDFAAFVERRLGVPSSDAAAGSGVE
jgi:menaquinone-dependent protoporphyrinogen IX oxidase